MARNKATTPIPMGGVPLSVQEFSDMLPPLSPEDAQQYIADMQAIKDAERRGAAMLGIIVK